ncbi:hypothetical protein NA57DRAFT_51393 [Rhizodiscina lignyota]|uniref:Malate dehydrogenase n=1 Tax=Rhizodiscina lignyota TaxID=1504668 RepID=A0A9P4MBN9_9PEZI|nr:hypothetical protein NA57DRAFT_51393 [Rhizodiscina lignyota]
MHFSVVSSLLLSTILSSVHVIAAPAQQEKRDAWNKALGWPEPEYNYYKAVGDTVEKAARANQLVNQPACNMQLAQMPQAPTPLPPPSAGLVLSHIAVGRGTQNYTCPKDADASVAPTAVGAVASLFNVSCIAGNYPQLLSLLPSVAVRYPVPTANSQLAPANVMLSGHHYFQDATTPFFNMITSDSNYGMVAAAKLNATNAPDAAKDVTWLKLNAKAGNWSFVEVYRVNTSGGQPPKTCEGQPENIEVQYAAEYWLWAPPK